MFLESIAHQVDSEILMSAVATIHKRNILPTKVKDIIRGQPPSLKDFNSGG